ncbi:MAG: hypothetical protein ACFCUM_16595 [Bacteroidales bacterium]
MLVETEPEARELWQQLEALAESYLSEKPSPIETGVLAEAGWLIESMEKEF